MQYFEKQGNALIFRQDGETVRVEPWQKDSLRVRGTLLSEIEEGSIALLDPEPVEAEIELVDELKATIKKKGESPFFMPSASAGDLTYGR